MAVFIIDDSAGSPQWVKTGTWSQSVGYGGEGNDYWFSNTPGSTASWNFTGLTAGQSLNAGLTWVASSNRSAAVPWQVIDSDGSTVLQSGTINQKVAPSGDYYDQPNNINFQQLASVTFSGTTGTIRITVPSSGYAIADAASLTTPQTPTVLTSVKDGDWGDPSVWSPAVGLVPSATIDAKINNAVTVSDARTVGTATVNYGGSLTVNGTLTVNVAVACGTSAGNGGNLAPMVKLGAGGGIEFDGASGTTPQLNLRPDAYLAISGTSGSHCYLRTKAGTAGNRAILVGGAGASRTNQIRGSWCDFARIGDLTHPFNDLCLMDTASSAFTVANCTFADCGTINLTLAHASAGFSVTYSRWSASSASDRLAITCNTAPATSGAWLIGRSSFDQNIKLNYPAGLLIDHCYLYGSTTGPAANVPWAGMVSCWNRQPRNTEARHFGPVTGCVIVDAWTGGNPHFVTFQVDADAPSTGQLFWSEGTGIGDGHNFPMVQTAPRSYTIRGLLSLPTAAGNQCGSLANFDGNDNVTASLEHCTGYVGSTGIVAYGETYAGHPGMLSSVRACLAVSSGSAGYKVLSNWSHSGGASGEVTDVCTPAATDYNGAFGVQQTNPGVSWLTNQGNGYAGKFSVTPGAHDPDVVAGNACNLDPKFVDPTRSPATFDVAYLGVPVAAAWSSGSPYAAGQLVSFTNPGWNFGKPANFRCIAGHTAGSDTQPFVGANWRTVWRLNTDYLIDQGITTLTYSPGTPRATVEDVQAWIRAGYAPREPLYHASYPGDGDTSTAVGGSPTIGAVAYSAPAPAFLAAWIHPAPALGTGVF